MKPKGFYPELESLRGLAALAVSLCHVFMAGAVFAKPFAEFSAGDWEQYALTTLTSSEGAVAIFFVLSGFVLSQGFPIERAYGARDYAAFLVRRVFRIMPAVVVAVLVCQFIRAEYFGAHETWRHIFGAMSLDMAQIDIDPPLWSLNVEMTTMLIFPLLVIANTRLSFSGQAIMLGILMAVASPGAGYTFAIHFAACFQLGIMAPRLAELIKNLSSRTAAMLFMFALVLVMAPTNISLHGWIDMVTHIRIEAIGAAYLVAYALARKGAALNRLLNTAPCRMLGRLSFSIYLLNYPLVAFSSTWLGAHIGTPAQFSVPFVFLTACLMLLLNLSGAVILHYAVERPFQVLGRKLAAAIVPSARPLLIPQVELAEGCQAAA
jgi:peptidoglycan/LPS O-acetylase OafA/YrhL